MMGERSRQLPHRFNIADAMISSDDLKTQLAALTNVAITCRFSGDVQQSGVAVSKAQNLLESASLSCVASIQVGLPFFRFQWGLTLYSLGSMFSISELETSYSLAQQQDHASAATRSANALAWVCAERGWISNAREWLEKAAVHARVSRTDPLHFLALGLVCADSGDVDRALEHLNAARVLGVGEWWAQEIWVRSLCVHDPGEAAVIESYAREAQERHDGWSHDSESMRLIHCANARLAAMRAPSRILRTNSQDRIAADDLNDATIDLAEGKKTSALERGIACEDSALTLRQQAQKLMIISTAAYELGRVELARSAFLRAHALVSEFSLVTTYDYLLPQCYEELFDLIGAQPPTAHKKFALHTGGLPALTRREREILTFLLTPMVIPEIAAELFISTNTVKTIVKHLYRKLEVTSRRQACDKAQLAGIRPAVIPSRKSDEAAALAS